MMSLLESGVEVDQNSESLPAACEVSTSSSSLGITSVGTPCDSGLGMALESVTLAFGMSMALGAIMSASGKLGACYHPLPNFCGGAMLGAGSAQQQSGQCPAAPTRSACTGPGNKSATSVMHNVLCQEGCWRHIIEFITQHRQTSSKREAKDSQKQARVRHSAHNIK